MISTKRLLVERGGAHLSAVPCVCMAENIPLVIGSLTLYAMFG